MGIEYQFRGTLANKNALYNILTYQLGIASGVFQHVDEDYAKLLYYIYLLANSPDPRAKVKVVRDIHHNGTFDSGIPNELLWFNVVLYDPEYPELITGSRELHVYVNYSDVYGLPVHVDKSPQGDPMVHVPGYWTFVGIVNPGGSYVTIDDLY